MPVWGIRPSSKPLPLWQKALDAFFYWLIKALFLALLVGGVLRAAGYVG